MSKSRLCPCVLIRKKNTKFVNIEWLNLGFDCNEK